MYWCKTSKFLLIDQTMKEITLAQETLSKDRKQNDSTINLNKTLEL